jgi:xanthosine utilization system XapX-like protein
MQTFRRLNDAERYWGLSWRGWLGAGAAGGVLYAAVRLSPLPTKPTITVAVLVLALVGTVLYALSGQALGPGRYAAAVVRYRLATKQLGCPARPDKRGLVLDSESSDETEGHVTAEEEVRF